MLYRENGQFKTTYRADQQIFPILQDRIAIALLLAIAFVAVPLLASEYFFRAILIPFLILSLAALGLNILVGFQRRRLRAERARRQHEGHKRRNLPVSCSSVHVELQWPPSYR